MKKVVEKIETERKPSLLLLLACLLLLLLGSATSQAQDDSIKIAMSRNIPGKNGFTTCQVFANALYKRMIQAGGEAHLVTFKWWKSGRTGRHAVVVFRDSRDRYWGMDSRAQKPKLLRGQAPGRWMSSFCRGYSVRVVSARTDRRFKGQFASLSRRMPTIAQAQPTLVAQAKPKKRHIPVRSSRKAALLARKASKPSSAPASTTKKAVVVAAAPKVAATSSLVSPGVEMAWKPLWEEEPLSWNFYMRSKEPIDPFTPFGKKKVFSRMQLPLRLKGPYSLAKNDEFLSWEPLWLSTGVVPSLLAFAKPPINTAEMVF